MQAMTLGSRRLVMPVTRRQCRQKLVRVAAPQYDEEGLLDVKFVPLTGAEGWADAAFAAKFASDAF